MLKSILVMGGAFALLEGAPVAAASFGGVDFPDGALSFADEVVLYDPLFGGGLQPSDAAARDAAEALGIPDYTSSPGIDYVSLGDGGRLVLRFTDNSLTGSGDNALEI